SRGGPTYSLTGPILQVKQAIFRLRRRFQMRPDAVGASALPPLVASGVPPDVVGGILPPGRKACTYLRVGAVFSDCCVERFFRRARCPALRQARGPPLRGSAPRRR